MDLITNTEELFDGAALYYEMETLNKLVKSKTQKHDLLKDIKHYYNILENFNSYPIEVRKKIFNDFTVYSEILKSALNSLEGKFSDNKILWNTLRKLKLSFSDDLFETIEDGDIIEIYRNDNIQIYRNFRFHELCNYDLPELFTMPWDQLFYREPFFTKLMLNTSMSIFQSKERARVSLNHIKPHEMIELKSPDDSKVIMELKFAYPLFSDTEYPEYLLSISKVTKV